MGGRGSWRVKSCSTGPDLAQGELGKGQDVAAITGQMLGHSPVFLMTIKVTNALPRALVIAQAVPAQMIKSEMRRKRSPTCSITTGGSSLDGRETFSSDSRPDPGLSVRHVRCRPGGHPWRGQPDSSLLGGTAGRRGTRVRSKTVQAQMPITTPCIKKKPAPVEYGWRNRPLPAGKDEANTLKIQGRNPAQGSRAGKGPRSGLEGRHR